MKPDQHSLIDPLYIIFEQHLYNFEDSESERSAFIRAIVNDYLTYLRKNRVSVPKALEPLVVEELKSQVNTMLIKKIYGCLTIEGYRKSLTQQQRTGARRRYQKLAGHTKA